MFKIILVIDGHKVEAEKHKGTHKWGYNKDNGMFTFYNN